MTDLWRTGPTAAAFGLRALEFSPQQAERLVAVKLHYQRASSAN